MFIGVLLTIDFNLNESDKIDGIIEFSVISRELTWQKTSFSHNLTWV